ncbi:HXXEE domain-containing protein [Muricoccus radiodurans]|uniref:HXXEE domain-containing protein n=1 Tax=Muricoccus radiodurans TaxID=2231721 RepID=UPI003CF23B46
MNAFDSLWPWVGLGAAVLLLPLLFATDRLRADPALPRGRDLVWLAWAGTCAYVLHQFEEHGVDARGQAYAFRGNLCAALGHADPAACPVPAAFITAVNIAAVWMAGPVCAWLGRRRPALALSFFATPFVNLFAHAGPAIAAGAYNPGLLTGLLLFLPLSFWSFRVAWGDRRVGPRAIVATILGGVVMHIVLLGSLLAFMDGRIGTGPLLLIQVVNPAIPILLVAAALASRGRSRAIP